MDAFFSMDSNIPTNEEVEAFKQSLTDMQLAHFDSDFGSHRLATLAIGALKIALDHELTEEEKVKQMSASLSESVEFATDSGLVAHLISVLEASDQA